MKKAFWQMHLSIFLWGFTGILGKLIGLQELVLVWYRLLFTCIVLYFMFFLKRRPDKIPIKEFLRIAGVGGIIAIHWVLFYGAIKYSNVSVTLSCFSSLALFTAILDPILTKKKFHMGELTFGVLAMAGIYLIFRFQDFYAVGICMALGSALLGSLFTILNHSLVKKYPARLVTFYELGSGFIWISLLMPLYLKIFPGHTVIPGMNDLIYLLILSIACTAIPFTLSLVALKEISAFTMNLSVNLEPLYSIILAILIFHENKDLTWGFYAGTAIILLSVVLHAIMRKRLIREVDIPPVQ